MSIVESLNVHRRTLGILVDPEKLDVDGFPAFAKALQSSTTNLTSSLDLDQIIVLIGGSTMEAIDLDAWIISFKKCVNFKTLLFPGSANQITEHADGLLFLNLISGRNPEYLIGQQVVAASKLQSTQLEIIPTAYILLNGGKQTAVERVSGTSPMDQKAVNEIVNTAFAGELMGNQLVYLEAGSGALNAVAVNIVHKVNDVVSIPIIVGGGLRTVEQIQLRFEAGASMVVVGTVMEEDLNWKG